MVVVFFYRNAVLMCYRELQNQHLQEEEVFAMCVASALRCNAIE